MESREPACPEEELVNSFRRYTLSSGLEPDVYLSWEGSLTKLIEWTRTGIGQEKLADGRTVPLFLALLTKVHEGCLKVPQLGFIRILQLLLKLLRNLCVSDSNKNAFLAGHGVSFLVQISAALLPASSLSRDSNHPAETPTFPKVPNEPMIGSVSSLSEIRTSLEAVGRNSCTSEATSTCGKYAGEISASAATESLRMLLQLLGNFSRGGDECQTAIWREFFPAMFTELALLRVNSISDVICMILCTCCRDSTERSWQLCQGQGVGLMSLLISSAVTNEETRDEKQIYWFESLWRHLCLEENLFPLLFTNLGIIPMRQELELSKYQTEEYFCACQIWLRTCEFTFVQVRLFHLLLEALHDYLDGEETCLKLFMPEDTLSFTVKVLERAADCAREELGTPPSSPTIKVLGYSLQFWRLLCTCDTNTEQQKVLTQVFLQHSLLDLLLKMLEALGPPEPPGRVRETFSGPAGVPSTDPYQGYRRDIVAVVANIAHENKLAQNYVREKGKLLVVLQQCTVDRDNPFLREWGLWAMRNLLEGNEMNGKEVASLEMKETVNLPELTDMGLRFEVDPSTGGPRLVNIESRAITRYIATKYEGQGTPLYGKTPTEKALVEQWVEVESQNYQPVTSALSFELFIKKLFTGAGPDEAAVAAEVPKLNAVLDIYEARLTEICKYLAGDFFSLADLSHFANTEYFVKHSGKSDLITSRPHVAAWWQDISSRPSWQKTIAYCSF
ncbi:hypothetical protein R1sor_009981 [Riccia sorocarpa]|uniref:glutathione transferase n=1 Tax=Riccia sorocarpa TaxID=122646 RepID=A0ABD3I087_9MARC